MADYSTVDLDEARRIGRRLDVQVYALRPLTGGMRNSSFVLETEAGRLVLSVLDGHDLDSAVALADLSAALADAGLPTPGPLTAPGQGRVLVSHSGRPVVVRPHVAGAVLSPAPVEELDSIGRLLGAIHTLDPPVALPHPTRRLPETWRRRVDGRADPALIGLIDAVDGFGQELAQPTLPQGLTHGDLFDDNLVLNHDGWHVIDWEYAAHDALVLDLAIATIGVCRAGDATALDPARVELLLRGYEHVRPLDPTERAVLGPAVRYGAAVLAYERWVRHNLDWPDPTHASSHAELVDLAAALGSNGLVAGGPT